MINRKRPTLLIVVGDFLNIALPIIIMLIGESLKAVALSIITMWRGVPSVLSDMAEAWSQDAHDHGWPSLWRRQITTFFWWVALATFVIGYILSAYLTIFILRLIF